MDTHGGDQEKRYCYVDHQLNHNNFAPQNQDIYNLATGMDNMINSSTWKEYFSTSSAAAKNHHHSGGGGPSSSKLDFYHYAPNEGPTHETLLGGVPHDHDTYVVDDSSLRCVFPCEGNERPSQGLSLSLSSTNPSTIALQSFELRHPIMEMQQQSHHDHQEILQEGYLGKVLSSTNPSYANNNNNNGYSNFQIRGSKYLGPAQDLLNEFCNLGSKQTDPKSNKAQKNGTTIQWENENNIASGSKKQALYALEVLDLQKRKTKLLAMLEQVDRRYRHYCDQMKAVVSSFEAVAGNGAAKIYSEMASKAMSRHFRCLRDGIVAQIKATKMAMGEKDTSAPGTTRGETPRLRLLDQTLRQQRAFQQMSMIESHPWRPQRGLPERSVSVLRAWLFEHFLHPYPSDVDKHILARQTGLSRSQVSNWFINARVRLWKPMVEEMYLEETKDQDNNNLASTDHDHHNNNNNIIIGRPSQNQQNPRANTELDQKPTLAQLGRIDSECLSSIIINPDKNDNNNENQHHHQGFARVSTHEQFGAVELDFSSYGGTHHGGAGNNVSLTLGLQQHGENNSGVSLAFTQAMSQQGSLFYPRGDHMEDCTQTVQFSLLDGEAQNLPYRNLMGAQLLHDYAG